MHKKFFKNLALLVFLNLLIKPFWIFGIDREVQNLVGPEEYGFYFAIYNFSFLFYIFLDLGITNFNNRNIAQNNQLLNKHLAGIGTMKLFLGLLYAVAVFMVGVAIGYNGRQLYLLAWVGFNQFLLSTILYLRSNISGLLLFKTDSVISILDRGLLIVLCAILLWTNTFRGKFTIEWFVYAQTIAYGLTAIISLLAVLNRSGRLRLNWNLPFSILILKKSLPFALLVLLMSFYYRIDPVLIERLLPGTLGEHQSGIYAQAFRLMDAGQNFALLFAVLLLPLFSKMIKEKQSVEHLVKLSFSMIISSALVLAISSAFYGKEIMFLLYSKFGAETQQEYLMRIEQATRIFNLLMFSFVAISSNYIFGTLLTANNNLKVLNYIALAGLCLNLILNFILIPKMYAFGSAIASLSTQYLTASLQIFFAYKFLKLKADKGLIFGLLFTIVLLVATGYLIGFLSINNWMIGFGALIFAGILYAFVFRLLHIREFFAVLKAD